MSKNRLPPATATGQLPDVSPKNKKLAFNHAIKAANPATRDRKPRLAASNGETVEQETSLQYITRCPADFRGAMAVLRRFALFHDLVVVGPCKLRGKVQQQIGKSEALVEAEASHSLVSEELLFPNLVVRGALKEELKAAAPILMSAADLSLDELALATETGPPEQDDERGRWPHYASRGRLAAWTIRIGEGKDKRYLVFLHAGEWVRWDGALPFDLPLFMGPPVPDGPKRVMIHEGAKAMEGAAASEDPYLRRFQHVAWQGGRAGIGHTDFTPILDAEEIVLWPDMDEAGLLTMDELGKRLALSGATPSIIGWPKELIAKHHAWDLGDKIFPGFPSTTDIIGWQKVIELAFNARGFPHEDFLLRTAYDPDTRALHMLGQGFTPIKPESFTALNGKAALDKIVPRILRTNHVGGEVFLPGRPLGAIVNGMVNCCPPNPRSWLKAAPLTKREWKFWRKAVFGMVADREQAKHLIRRMAWAIGHPEQTPQHMVVLRGDSGIGKSAVLSALCRVVGANAKELGGAFLNDKWSSDIANRSVVALHEIHSNSQNRKENSDRFKDLIGNAQINITTKFKHNRSVPNVIHWFGSTNEYLPFQLAHGNDRFYFVDCKSKKRPKYFTKFFRELDGRLDDLYAAALSLCESMKADTRQRMVGRSPRQQAHQEMAARSRPAWQQNIEMSLSEIYEGYEGNVPPCFIPKVFFQREQKLARWLTEAEVHTFLLESGYQSLDRFMINKLRVRVWAKQSDLPRLQRLRKRGVKLLPIGRARVGGEDEG